MRLRWMILRGPIGAPRVSGIFKKKYYCNIGVLQILEGLCVPLLSDRSLLLNLA